MTTSPQKYATTHQNLIDRMHGTESPFVQRLKLELDQKLGSALESSMPLHMVLPPGIEPAHLLRELLALKSHTPHFYDCRKDSPEVELPADAGKVSVLVVLYPELLASGEFERLTSKTSVDGRLLYVIINAFPTGLHRSVAQPALLMPSRSFVYSIADVEYLLSELREPGPALDEEAEGISAFELLRESGGWPAITEAVALVSREPLASPAQADEPSHSRSSDQLGRAFVSDVFSQTWLPLLLARHEWLLQICGLPMLSLDLLVHLFPDVDASFSQCLGIGLLEPCIGQPGLYQVTESLDGLLLVLASDYRDDAIIEEAARWYQHQGYISEAIESLVTLGVKEEILSSLQEGFVAIKAPQRNGVGSSQAIVDMGSSSVLARTAYGGVRPGLPASIRVSRADIEAASGTTGLDQNDAADRDDNSEVLTHMLSAYYHHRGKNSVAVASAITAAIDLGVGREELTSLIDFIDVHIRPLLAGGSGPLNFVLKDIRHSAPAREAVAAQAQSLNHRELQILQRICEGYRNREISEQLGLELSTIKWYSTRIYEKLQVRNRTQAVARAQVLRLFDRDA